MILVFGVVVLGCLSLGATIPYREGREEKVDVSFIGEGTNDLATALLQGHVGKKEDMVFSPFSYSVLLAVFAEGARGKSREEIAEVLHFPKEVDAVRLAYKTLLERFVQRKTSSSPEFKNWFYIYKNYTVNKELENVLRKYYLTDVRSVSPPETYLEDMGQFGQFTDGKPEKTTQEVPVEQSTENAKPTSPTVLESLMKEESSVKLSELEGMMMKEEESEAKPTKPEEMVKEEESEAKPAKQEKVKNEKSEAKRIIPQKMVMEEKSELKLTKPQMEGTKEEEIEAKVEEKKEKNLNLEKSEDAKTENQQKEEDLNGVVWEMDTSLRIKNEDANPRMVIFNGLYYKGEWEIPFTKKRADDSRPFYKSDDEKVFVSTIYSQGVYNFGDLPDLDCKAIELPYKGGRYSLLVLVPNTRNGLSKLVSDLTGYSFRGISERLSLKLVDVCLPSFHVKTIASPIRPQRRLGLNKVTSIFNPETANLTGVSANVSKLFVEELVQMVTFKVDSEFSKADFLTASIASSRSNVPTFQINQPFLFYLRDNIDNIIIVNGKVLDPTPKPSHYYS